MVTEILGKPMAAENKDCISQVPLQLKVALWLCSKKWDVMHMPQGKF